MGITIGTTPYLLKTDTTKYKSPGKLILSGFFFGLLPLQKIGELDHIDINDQINFKLSF